MPGRPPTPALIAESGINMPNGDAASPGHAFTLAGVIDLAEPVYGSGITEP
ncbi:MAG TPA: hypothetical protein VFQ68_36555 [Streptosporangiaceae bacterium]|nr:hypothetical protein [Streptosporangiaceae bacterium]